MHLPTGAKFGDGVLFPMSKEPNDTYSDEEAARRATEALRRSLTLPHKPQKEIVGKVRRAKPPRAPKPKSSPEDR